MKHCDFHQRNAHRVYTIRKRDDMADYVEVVVMPAKGMSYRLFPRPRELAATLLRDVGVWDIGMRSPRIDRIAAALSATPLLQRDPPWEITETEIRAFADAAEAFR